jgi:chromatin remodeling complex protein RSC6
VTEEKIAIRGLFPEGERAIRTRFSEGKVDGKGCFSPWAVLGRRHGYRFNTPFSTSPSEGRRLRMAAKKAAAKKTTAAAKKAPAKKAAAGAKRKPNAAFMKEFTPSPELAAVIGSTPVPRTGVIKKLWDYIKKNSLNQGQLINLDEKLKAVYGNKKQIKMTEVAQAFKHLK